MPATRGMESFSGGGGREGERKGSTDVSPLAVDGI